MKVLLSNSIERVSIYEANDIGTISFASTKANSLGSDALNAIKDGIDQLTANSNIRVVILASEGESTFCAGASFDEVNSLSNTGEAEQFFLGFAKVILAMKESGKFIIGRIQGKCVGGGVGLVAACDYAIGCDTAAFRLSEFELGIGPFVVAAPIQRKVGLAAFSECTIDSKWRDSNWAIKNNLLSSVVGSSSELTGAVQNLATELAKRSPLATKAIKEMLWSGTENWEQLMDMRAKTVAGLLIQGRTQSQP